VEIHRSPLRCELFVLSDRDRLRRDELVSALGHSLRELYELEQGYGLVFEPSAGTLAELVEFIALERLCCPFLNFQLNVQSDNGPVRLEMTGREGVKQFLTTELGIQGGAPD
jgi:hypothetical protein